MTAGVDDDPSAGGRTDIELLGSVETTDLDRLRAVSDVLDNAIRVPGTEYRIGLDPILGLVPVVGDAPGAAASAYIVAVATTLGVPRATLARMVLNLLVDALVGSIPVVGDVFDAVWKANARNVKLVEARLDAPESAALDRRVLVLVTAAVFVLVFVVGAVLTLGVLWVFSQVA